MKTRIAILLTLAICLTARAQSRVSFIGGDGANLTDIYIAHLSSNGLPATFASNTIYSIVFTNGQWTVIPSPSGGATPTFNSSVFASLGGATNLAPAAAVGATGTNVSFNNSTNNNETLTGSASITGGPFCLGSFWTNYLISTGATNSSTCLIVSNILPSLIMGTITCQVVVDGSPVPVSGAGWQGMSTNLCAHAEKTYLMVVTNTSASPLLYPGTGSVSSGGAFSLPSAPTVGTSPQSYFTISLSGLNSSTTNRITGYARITCAPNQ